MKLVYSKHPPPLAYNRIAKYQIRGGSLKSKLKQLYRLGVPLANFMAPVASEVGKQVAEQALPGLGSVAQDKFNELGMSDVGDAVASIAVDGAKSLSSGDRKDNFVADQVSDLLNNRIANLATGQGNRRVGSGNRRVGSGNRQLGSGNRQLGSGNRQLGSGIRQFPNANRLLGDGFFSSLDVEPSV